MAYNPFDFFRTNQKILFSVMTVIIMFVFVLSIGGGRGDFFNWFPDMLRANRSTGEVVAAIDGTDIKESRVSDTRRTRKSANQFMAAAQVRAADNLNRFVRESAKRVSPDLQSQLTRYFTAESNAQKQLPQLEQFLQGNAGNQQLVQMIRQNANQLIEEVNGALRGIMAFGSRPNLKGDDAEVVSAMKKLQQLRSVPTAERHYFAEMPNKSARDALEFMLWTKKADALGIRFRNDDVDAMVGQEFLQFTAADRERTVAETLGEGGQRPLTRDKLYAALAAEFRVRAAMLAVLGPMEARGVESISPFDLYEFYRKETSYARYGVISFPVDNFLDQVQGEPGDQELKRLFDLARTTEPNPADPRPGIKEPRKLKLQYVEATGKEPFYAAAGTDAILKTEVNAKLATLFTVPFGVGGAALFAAPTVVAMPEPALEERYTRYKDDQKLIVKRRWFPGFHSENSPVPGDSSVVNLATIFSAAGLGAATPLGSPTALLSVPMTMIGVAEAAEHRARLNYGFALFAPPLFDGLAGLGDVTAALAVQGMAVPQPLPLAAVKPMLARELTEKMRYRVCQTDLEKFHDEWKKLSEQTDKEKAAKEIQDYIGKFTGTAPWKDKDGKDQAGRGLKVAGSADFRDQYTLLQEPALAPLVKQWTDSNPREYHEPASFAVPFFNSFDPRTRRQTPGALFEPILYPFRTVPEPTDLTPVFIVWRSAELPAEPARRLDDVRPKVVAIWKRQKARELAKAAADELVKQFDGKLGSNFIEIGQKLTSARTEFANAKFTTPQLRERVRQFEIPGVEELGVKGVGRAIVGEQFNPQTGDSGYVLQPFELRRSERIPYASEKMAEELVANRNKELSTAFTFTDPPESTVYVAVLEDRTEETPSRFNSIVYSPGAKGPTQVSMAVQNAFLNNSRQDARRLAVELLKTEFGYEKESPDLDKKNSDSAE